MTMDLDRSIEQGDGIPLLLGFVKSTLAGNVRGSEVEHRWDLESEIPQITEGLRQLKSHICQFVGIVEQFASRRVGELESSSSDTQPSISDHLSDSITVMAESDNEYTTGPSSTSESEALRRSPAAQLSTDPISGRQVNPRLDSTLKVSIPHREEDGVVVLLPHSMTQCRDTPFLIAQAEKLGARQTGVFKYVLPDDCDTAIERGSGRRKVSTFISKGCGGGVHNIKSHASEEEIEIGEPRSRSKDVETLAVEFERLLRDPGRLGQIRYCTDQPARNRKQRQELGLPSVSPIGPLEHTRKASH